MPSTQLSEPDSPLLQALFQEIDKAPDEKTKSLALGKAKRYILNEMKPDTIRQFFGKDTQNYKSLFDLMIWQQKGGDYLEPYEIVEKILSCFTDLVKFVEEFGEQIVFSIDQNEDEKVKCLLVKHMIKLTKTLRDVDFEEYPDPCGKLTFIEGVLKKMLLHFVAQIPLLSVTFSTLVGQLFCHLTTRLNKIESTLIEKHHNIHAVFSTSIFDDNPQLTQEFERVSNMSSTMKIRVLDIFVNLATISKDHLVAISEPNFIDKNLKDLLNSNDILSRVNVIELLTDLSVTFHGYEFLIHRGHLKGIFEDLLEFNLLNTIESKPFGFCEAAAIVKLFANITRTMPDKMKSDFPDFINIILDYGMLEDVIKWEFQINLALQTVTYLFESNTCKMFVYENYKEKLSSFLKRLTFIVQKVIATSLQSNSITCLAVVLALDPELLRVEHCETRWLASPWIQSMEHVSEELFERVVADCSEESLFKTLYEFAKEPFPETRLAALTFFKSLAQSKWGLKLLFSDKKFLKKTEFVSKYLCNRGIEVEKEGLESKLELIKLVSYNFKLNNELFPIIGEGDLEQLEQYVRLGAYYTPSGQKVAFQST